MAQQDLSPKAQDAVTALKALSPTELARVVAIASTELAAKIAGAVQTATPAQLTEASSKIVEGVQATLDHGFKKVKAPDGTDAIEVKITRPNGTEVTCLLSEGARGLLYSDLADYGRKKLAGATLRSGNDFKAVVDRLLNAINGQKPVNDVLQTEDEALNQAYKIVTQGVRRNLGFSWAVFNLDDTGAVAGRRIYDNAGFWYVLDDRGCCALFGASPAE